MLMLSERLQVLIGRDQRTRLEREAARRGTSVATLVREAIDQVYPPASIGRRTAADRILRAEPMDVPPVPALLEELDELRTRRA
jgi:hypothetical protein